MPAAHSTTICTCFGGIPTDKTQLSDVPGATRRIRGSHDNKFRRNASIARYANYNLFTALYRRRKIERMLYHCLWVCQVCVIGSAAFINISSVECVRHTLLVTITFQQ